MKYTLFVILMLFFPLLGLAQDPTDDCASAPDLTVNAGSCSNTAYSLSWFYANSASVTSGCNSGDQEDGWYNFDATSNVTNIELTGDYRFVLAVYSGACGSLSLIDCEEVPAGATASLKIETTVSTSYKIQIHRTGGFSDQTMSGNICVYTSSAPGGIANNLELWLKADEGVLNSGAAATDGQTVDTWQDQSLNRSNHPNSSALDAPVFRNNTTDNINFHPAMEFDGNNTGLDLAGDYIFADGSGMTMFGGLWPDATSGKTRQYITDFGFAGDAGYGFAYGPENIFGYTAFNSSGTYDDHNHSKGSYAAVARCDIDFGSSINLYVDGLLGSTDAMGLTQLTANEIWETPTHNTNYGPFTIGRQAKNDGLSSEGGRAYDGKMGDVIVYSSDLTATQSQKVESYLAVKYGVTLGSTSSPVDYITSQGTVVWNGSSTYQNDVAGIGRDDASGLEQKQSKSTNDDAIVTMGLGDIASSNASNANSFSSDEDFFVWGNDNDVIKALGVTDTGTTTNGERIEARVARTWFSKETGDVGTIKIRFDMSEIPGVDGTLGANDLADVRLLVDGDGTFANNALSVAPSSYDNSTDVVEFDHDFASGSNVYFSLGSVDASVAPLPVEFASFEAAFKGDHVQLKWVTATEINNDYFEIQRSENGEKWETIGIKQGSGNTHTQTSYSYADTDIGQLPEVVYYRIKQVDYDGDHSFSSIKSASINKNWQLSIFPNPVDNVMHIHCSDCAEGQKEITIYSTSGVEMLSRVFSGNHHTIRNINLRPGLYMVKVACHNNHLHKPERRTITITD